MIEFQLTVYMCSYCTCVYNAAQVCVRHELKEHSPNKASAVSTGAVGEIANTSATRLPFRIVDEEIKPDVHDSDIHRHVRRTKECTRSYTGEKLFKCRYCPMRFSVVGFDRSSD